MKKWAAEFRPYRESLEDDPFPFHFTPQETIDKIHEIILTEGEKQNSSFRNTKSANMQPSARGLLSAVQVLTLSLFGSNATSDGELGELSPTQSIPNILFILFLQELSSL